MVAGALENDGRAHLEIPSWISEGERGIRKTERAYQEVQERGWRYADFCGLRVSQWSLLPLLD